MLKFLTYGYSEQSDYVIKHLNCESGYQVFSIDLPQGESVTHTIKALGRHNVSNACAAFIACEQAAKAQAVAFDNSAKIFANYKGLKRRQELRFSDQSVLIFDDFAHHPSAVAETLHGFKQGYPNSRIVAVFEPRSNTSRQKLFQDQYSKAFDSADLVLFSEVTPRVVDEPEELMNSAEVVAEIERSGKTAKVLSNRLEEAVALVQKTIQDGDVVVFMSNGSFGGLIEKTIELLKN